MCQSDVRAPTQDQDRLTHGEVSHRPHRIGPIEWRLAEAKDRLRAGTQTISEIAFVGNWALAQALLFGVASALIGWDGDARRASYEPTSVCDPVQRALSFRSWV